MAELDDLSTTDASNTGRFPENQAPSTVNNGARALEGMIARFIQDINTSPEGTLSGSVIQVTASHTSLTLTGTTSNYRANLLIGWKMGASPNPSPVSLNLGGVGPISLRDNHGNTLSASVIMSGSRCLAVKDGDNDYFRLLFPGRDNFIEANGITDFLDEDSMASDSDTALASQQSIKAYVDTQIASVPGITINSTVTLSGQGTSYTSGSVPSGTKRITVVLEGMSMDGSFDPILQLGDSGGLETTGYTALAQSSGGTSINGTTSYTTGFGLNATGGPAATTITGHLTLVLSDSTNNTWTIEGTLQRTDSPALIKVSGIKSLSGELTQLGLTSTSGTPSFDAGTFVRIDE